MDGYERQIDREVGEGSAEMAAGTVEPSNNCVGRETVSLFVEMTQSCVFTSDID